MVRGNEYTQILTSTPRVGKFAGLTMLHSFDRIKIRQFLGEKLGLILSLYVLKH